MTLAQSSQVLSAVRGAYSGWIAEESWRRDGAICATLSKYIVQQRMQALVASTIDGPYALWSIHAYQLRRPYRVILPWRFSLALKAASYLSFVHIGTIGTFGSVDTVHLAPPGKQPTNHLYFLFVVVIVYHSSRTRGIQHYTSNQFHRDALLPRHSYLLPRPPRPPPYGSWPWPPGPHVRRRRLGNASYG